MAALGEMVRAGCSQRRSGTDLAASLQGGWVVWWAGQTSVGVDTSGAVRPEMAGLAIERGRD